MPLPKCLVPVERSGYAATPGPEVVSTQLEGGLSRYRQDQLGAGAQVTVQWTVGKADYNYLMAFYRQYKALPFTIDLILDSADTQEYTARIVSGTWTLNSQTGITYVLQATLEVQPLPPDTDGDTLLLARN